MPKVNLITNIPAPYREKIHELVSEHFAGDYFVTYCAEKEADREWKFTYGNYRKEILSGINKNAVHNNISVLKILNSFKPDVVIIMGFFPTMLYSYLWALLKGKKLIVFTDGTLISESKLSLVHRIIRKIVFAKTAAFIGPSNGAAELYASYGIQRNKFFRTYLAVNNQLFFKLPNNKKKYDLMFSGQFIDRKMPFFFIEIVRIVKEKLGKCSVLLLGSGPLKSAILEKLNLYGIDYSYPGFISQEELPQYYSLSKLFLFPTRNDPWGIVANEAMASGVPVITCKEAGVANDLIRNGENGFILPLIEQQWADTIIETFNNPVEYERLSQNALNDVKEYNFKNGAKGIIDAVASVF